MHQQFLSSLLHTEIGPNQAQHVTNFHDGIRQMRYFVTRTEHCLEVYAKTDGFAEFLQGLEVDVVCATVMTGKELAVAVKRTQKLYSPG